MLTRDLFVTVEVFHCGFWLVSLLHLPT